jgi:hypothetical protein
MKEPRRGTVIAEKDRVYVVNSDGQACEQRAENTESELQEREEKEPLTVVRPDEENISRHSERAEEQENASYQLGEN